MIRSRRGNSRVLAALKGEVLSVSAVTIPKGFKAFPHQEGYMALNGPYYLKDVGDGHFDYGFPSDDRHNNPNGVLHGGALFSFADSFLGHMIVTATGRHCATVTITTEFVAGAQAGSWIEGKAEIKKLTGRMAFINAEVSCKGELMMAVTGVFRLFGDV